MYKVACCRGKEKEKEKEKENDTHHFKPFMYVPLLSSSVMEMG